MSEQGKFFKPMEQRGLSGDKKRQYPALSEDHFFSLLSGETPLYEKQASAFAREQSHESTPQKAEKQEKVPGEITLSKRVLPLKSFNNKEYQNDELNPEENEQLVKVYEGAKKIGETRERFWNMLATTIERTGYTPPQDRQTVILDLACGTCVEGVVLNAYFGGDDFGSRANNNVQLVGVDIDEKDLARAEINNEAYDFTLPIPKPSLPPFVSFVSADATKLDEYPEVPDEADVVVIRHEQISASTEIWEKIFQQGINKLTPEGIMILTSYSDIEHEMALEALQRLECELVLTERNQFAQALGYDEVSEDRNIAVVRKKVPGPESLFTQERE